MKQMNVFRVHSVDLEKETCVITDGRHYIEIRTDGDVAVIPGQYWLVDLDDYALVVECQEETIDVFNDGVYVRYSFGREPEAIDMEHRQDPSDVNADRDNMKDVFEVEQIMKQDTSFESHHVLESGQSASIHAKIVGRALHQYCPELGVVRVSPLTPKVLKQMISTEGPVTYHPEHSLIAFPNGSHVQINEGEELEIFEDLVIDARKSADQTVTGTIRSSYIDNVPKVVVGKHTGKYFIDPSQSSIIYPEMEYVISPSLQSRIQFIMEPVPYDVFKRCVEQYLFSNWGMDRELLCEYLHREYTNLNGVPISLSLEDRIQLQERILGIERGRCAEYVRK